MNPNHQSIRAQSSSGLSSWLSRAEKISIAAAASRLAIAVVGFFSALPLSANECIVQQNPLAGGKTELQIVRVSRGPDTNGNANRVYYDTRFMNGGQLSDLALSDPQFQQLLSKDGSFFGASDTEFDAAVADCMNKVSFPEKSSDEAKRRACSNAISNGEDMLGDTAIRNRATVFNSPLGFSRLNNQRAWQNLKASRQATAQRLLSSTGTFALRVSSNDIGTKRAALKRALSRGTLGCSVVTPERQQAIETEYRKQKDADPACKLAGK